MKGRFLLPCRNQKVITTRDGRKMFVPCGYCPDCAIRKSNCANALCQAAASSHPFVFKVDLSYNDTFVPKMKLYEVVSKTGKRFIECKDITKRPIKTKGVHGDYTKRLPVYGKTIHYINSNFSDPLFQNFYEKSEAIHTKSVSRAKTFTPLPRYTLRYAYFKDCQDFIKRLRFYLAQECDASFSYYFVSEYGPQTFRPHFHGLLYFSDPRSLQALEKCVSKAWQYGNYICELSSSKGGCTSYVSSYINSFTHLPIFLRGEFIRPRASHSFRMGESVAKVVRDFVYKYPSRLFGVISVPVGSGVYKYYPSSTNINSLFPRCYDYSNKHISELYKLYSIYPKLRKIFRTNECSVLVDNILRFGIDTPTNQGAYIIKSFLSLLHISPYYYIQDTNGVVHPLYPSGSYNNKWLHLSTASYYDEILGQNPLTLKSRELDDYTLRLWTRIYSAVRLSKYVHDFCCEKMSFDDWFVMLVAFHKKLPLTRLGQFYREQQAYVDYTNDSSFDVFFPIRDGEPDFDYQSCFQGNLFLQSDIQCRDLEYSKRIKHKELNDLNKIFC